MTAITAWLLIFYGSGVMSGDPITVPGIASEDACKKLYETIKSRDRQVYKYDFHCIEYPIANATAVAR